MTVSPLVDVRIAASRTLLHSRISDRTNRRFVRLDKGNLRQIGDFNSEQSSLSRRLGSPSDKGRNQGKTILSHYRRVNLRLSEVDCNFARRHEFRTLPPGSSSVGNVRSQASVASASLSLFNSSRVASRLCSRSRIRSSCSTRARDCNFRICFWSFSWPVVESLITQAGNVPVIASPLSAARFRLAVHAALTRRLFVSDSSCPRCLSAISSHRSRARDLLAGEVLAKRVTGEHSS